MDTYTVYRLENIVTKKNYIGMTGDAPKKRWGGAYHGKMKEAIKQFPLDLCWKKHIEFQTADKKTALELESELMKWYDSVENGYNTSEYERGHFKRSEETKRKMSKSLTGRTFSEEHKKKLSDNHADVSGENNPNFGKHHKHSEESKKHISKSRGVNGILQFSKDGEFIAEYPSIMEASRQTGCNQGNICSCCKGKLKSTGGYIWQYA